MLFGHSPAQFISYQSSFLVVIITTASTANISGGTSFIGNQSSNGGAIRNSGALSIADTTFTNNRSGGTGGAIQSYHETGTATITDTTFNGNTAGSLGGAIFTYGNMDITRTTFEGNNSTGTAMGIGGGAIAFEGTTLNLNDAVFNNNTSGNYGKKRLFRIKNTLQIFYFFLH